MCKRRTLAWHVTAWLEPIIMWTRLPVPTKNPDIMRWIVLFIKINWKSQRHYLDKLGMRDESRERKKLNRKLKLTSVFLASSAKFFLTCLTLYRLNYTPPKRQHLENLHLDAKDKSSQGIKKKGRKKERETAWKKKNWKENVEPKFESCVSLRLPVFLYHDWLMEHMWNIKTSIQNEIVFYMWTYMCLEYVDLNSWSNRDKGSWLRPK